VQRNVFLDRLRQSRLLTEEELAAAAARFDGGEGAEAVLGGLADRGVLTRFQAARVLVGKGEDLVLGQYRVLDELGAGGFGRVYRALHTVMGRVVAVKVIAPELVEDERARAWFKREVLAVTQLYHPNIVMAYDANEADGRLFLVMEYVEGQNLDTLLRRQGPLPLAPACEMMRQAARALQYAHDKGIVHRDIKPGNMLIPAEALAPPAAGAAPVVLKVVDFGLARLHHSARGNTLQVHNEKSFLGTPDYVSPEQAQNVHAVDIRSDLYSLGCTFYHVLAGRRPFRGATALETVVKHLKEDAEPLEQVRPETPPALCAAVQRLMEKDPARRFQTPTELLAELDLLCGQDAARPAAGQTQSRPLFRPAAGKAEPAPPHALANTAVVPYLALGRGPDPPGGEGAASQEAAATPLPSSLATVGGREVVAAGPAGAPVVGGTAAEAERVPPSPAELARLDAALRQAWQRWTAVVGAFARGRGWARVSEEAYRALHAGLLEVCREQAEAADGPQRAAFERLRGIAEPWLTPRSLAAADAETLTSLWQRCRQVEQELGVGGGVNLWGWAAVAAALAVAIFLGWRLSQVQRVGGSPASWWAALKRVVLGNPVLWTLLALPAVVLGSIAFLVRRLRL
jgi:serine/threonine protein kinase